jgi:hypothetical protein
MTIAGVKASAKRAREATDLGKKIDHLADALAALAAALDQQANDRTGPQRKAVKRFKSFF